MSVTRRAMGVAAFTAAAAGGAVMGFLGERRALHDIAPEVDPEWAELRRPIRGEARRVTAFDGTQLYAEVLGSGDGPYVVFGHGYGLSQQVWHYQRRDLQADHRLVFFDQRGHAGSEPAASGDWSTAALGRDLGAVIDACVPDGGPIVVVGHSMSGMALLSWIEQFPQEAEERLVGAVFVDSAGGDVVAGGLFSTGFAALSVLEGKVLDIGQRLVRRGARVADTVYGASTDLSYLLTRAIGMNPDASPAHVAFLEQMFLNCPSSVLAALGPALSSVNLLDVAPLVTCPALVLVGEKDRVTPPRQALILADALPDSRMVVLPGVGHTSPIEAHEAVTEHLRAFLAGPVARAA